MTERMHEAERKAQGGCEIMYASYQTSQRSASSGMGCVV